MAKRQHNRRDVHGILLVDKPLHMSSNQALQQMKRLFNAKKAGHAGSLDPLATGMLPISFGEATKFASHVLDADKEYDVEGLLGLTTTSGDGEGEILDRKTVPSDWRARLPDILARFEGEQDQHAPLYSALKYNGKPLYEYARQGIEVERKCRRICIHSIQLLSADNERFRIRVKCSKGTYIRSLIEDIGMAMGCGAYVTYLRRNWVAPFSRQMLSFEALHQAAENGLSALDALLLNADAALGHYSTHDINDQDFTLILNGRVAPLNAQPMAEKTSTMDTVRLYYRQNFIGLGVRKPGIEVAPKRMMAVDVLKSFSSTSGVSTP